MFARARVIIATLFCATFLATVARAKEGTVFNAEAGVGSGFEGDDPGIGQIGWRRARIRVLGGLHLRTDEDESNGIGLRAFAEIEKRGSVGAEARYERWISQKFSVFAGLIGTVAPETLFGGGFGARLTIPMGSRLGIFVEPAFYALPAGSDLPGKTVLLWGLVSVGVDVGL
jgi:hypothetical protein